MGLHPFSSHMCHGLLVEVVIAYVVLAGISQNCDKIYLLILLHDTLVEASCLGPASVVETFLGEVIVHDIHTLIVPRDLMNWGRLRSWKGFCATDITSWFGSVDVGVKLRNTNVSKKNYVTMFH